MSTALHVYAVPFVRLKALSSGQDQTLQRAILRDQAEEIEQINRTSEEKRSQEL